MIEEARLYANQGFWVIPIPFKTKRPIIENWPNLRITSADLPKHFNGKRQNIGVLLGLEPNRLVDIDLDSDLAVRLADFFLPKTDAIFGRKSKPRSHWFYFTKFPKTEKFIDPFETNPKMATIVEIRSKGGQTIIPPSTHPTGELITWCSNGSPLQIAPCELRRAVTLLASACVLTRFWRGARHDMSLALAGALLQNGVSNDEVTNLIRAICFAAGDEEIADRIQSVKTTAERVRRNEPVSGLSKLSELTSPQLVNLLCKWLNLKSSSINPNVSALAKHNRQTSFDLTRLDELLSEPEEEHSYVLEGTLITGGLSICSAKPKVGKSTFARNLARAIVTGDMLLGRPTLKGRVIYLCLEEKRSEIAKQFKQMGIEGGDIWVHTGPSPAAALAALEEAIQRVKPVLVIIDPLARVLRVRDYNDYGSMARALEPFIDLARRTNVHIIALHHEGKSDREGGDAILGSTALYGAVDCHIQMRKKSSHRTISTTQRYGEDLPETVIELDKQKGIVLEKGELHSILLDQKKSEVLEIIGVNEKLSESEIKDRVRGNSEGVISKALRLLVEESLVKREGGGKKNSPYLYFREQLPKSPADLIPVETNGK